MAWTIIKFTKWREIGCKFLQTELLQEFIQFPRTSHWRRILPEAVHKLLNKCSFCVFPSFFPRLNPQGMSHNWTRIAAPLDGKPVIPQLETPQDAAVLSSRHHNPAFHPPASQTLFYFDDAASLVTCHCHVIFYASRRRGCCCRWRCVWVTLLWMWGCVCCWVWGWTSSCEEPLSVDHEGVRFHGRRRVVQGVCVLRRFAL